MRLTENARHIIEELNKSRDWMDKYDYFIELAKALPPMLLEDKNEENQIKGCQSRVWIKAWKEGEILRLSADSDAMITKGLAALLVSICDGVLCEEIQKSDFDFLRKTGIKTHLSPSRANGFASMVARIKELSRLV